MAHMIENTNAVFSAKPAWHGLGIILADNMTWQDVVAANPLFGSKIVEQPLFTKGPATGFGDVKTHKAIIREADGKIVGMVGSDYAVHQIAQGVELAEVMAQDGRILYESAAFLHDGHRMFLLARVPEPLTILGDDYAQYLVFSTSFDGSLNTQVAFTPTRVVCQNTLTMALKGNNRVIKIRHTGNTKNKFDRAAEVLKLNAGYSAALQHAAEVMARVPFGEKEYQGLLDALLPLPEDLKSRAYSNAQERRSQVWRAIRAEDLRNIVATGFGAYNAVADWLQHADPMRKTATFQEARFEDTVAGHPLLDKAQEYIRSVAVSMARS